jgi:hypothetical protein
VSITTAVARQITAPSETDTYAWDGSLSRDSETGAIRLALLRDRDEAGDLVIDRGKADALYSMLKWLLEHGFEAADTPVMFAWGESISTTDAGRTVNIPVHHGGNYIGDIHMPLAEAVVLRDMLDELVSEAQQKQAASHG